MYPWLETGPSSSSLKWSSSATGSCGIFITVHRLCDSTCQWNHGHTVSETEMRQLHIEDCCRGCPGRTAFLELVQIMKCVKETVFEFYYRMTITILKIKAWYERLLKLKYLLLKTSWYTSCRLRVSVEEWTGDCKVDVRIWSECGVNARKWRMCWKKCFSQRHCTRWDASGCPGQQPPFRHLHRLINPYLSIISPVLSQHYDPDIDTNLSIKIAVMQWYQWRKKKY